MQCLYVYMDQSMIPPYLPEYLIAGSTCGSGMKPLAASSRDAGKPKNILAL